MALRSAAAVEAGVIDVDEDVADEQAEPADFDGDGFGGQLPAGRDGRDALGGHDAPRGPHGMRRGLNLIIGEPVPSRPIRPVRLVVMVHLSVISFRTPSTPARSGAGFPARGPRPGWRRCPARRRYPRRRSRK